MIWSALTFHGRTVCYKIVSAHGDTFVVNARELGRSEPLPLTDELRAAIAAELERQEAKRKEAG